MDIKLLLVAIFVGVMILMACGSSQERKKVIFFGDSITESAIKPGGYVLKMQSMIANEGQEDKYQLIGSGVSGDKIYDLYRRMEKDVLSKGPSIVVIFIGVNDVWHKLIRQSGTDIEKFKVFYNDIIDKLEAANAKVIVCTPGVVGEKTDGTNELDQELDKYSQEIRDIADDRDLKLVDLRRIFKQYNLQHNKENVESGILTSDRVHLNDKGNQLVAEEMWKAIKDL